MKKVVTIAVAALAVGVATADLSIDWRSLAGGVTAPEGAPNYLVGSTIQLIWSPDGAQTISGGYEVIGGALLPGEVLLDSGITGENSSWTGLGGIYVGDYTGGEFFTRIFESDGADGEFFLDIPMGDGDDFVYDPSVLNTTFSDNTFTGVLNINQNGTYVVPEPATIGLMGIAGLGMFLARRKVRR
ncbi:PEP-CTERM sorting domain-containing protein [Verrucomicrobia bacterium S94]|nr:PEP-CTERM sorting domain-containing protein [Verrucomicrobia bacterium S94]